MNKDYYKRKDCRQCHSQDLSIAINLNPTPLANDYIYEKDLKIIKKKYPLDVYFCNSCKHLQLLDVVNPKKLYENYVYVSGTSSAFVKHFEKYAEYLNHNFNSEGLVIDIGSNDGTILKAFKRFGYEVLGVEPAKAIAEEAIKNGIETIIDFFNPVVASEIKKKYGEVSIITANNVFAHIDNPSDFLAGVRKIISSDNGVFCFEVSYLKDVIENTFFDTIYHEHLDYHSLLSLRGFLKRNGFEIIDALKVATHGGSIRVISQKIGGKYKISESVNKLIDEEYNTGLHKLSTFVNFSSQIEKTRENLIKVLKDLKDQGKSIIGYGAPAKATTLMHHFDIGPEEIDYIVDDSKWKQNLYTPGKKIKILPVNNMYEDNPDYVLILAWNFADFIIKKNKKFHDNGGKFIVPLPKVKII